MEFSSAIKDRIGQTLLTLAGLTEERVLTKSGPANHVFSGQNCKFFLLQQKNVTRSSSPSLLHLLYYLAIYYSHL